MRLVVLHVVTGRTLNFTYR